MKTIQKQPLPIVDKKTKNFSKSDAQYLVGLLSILLTVKARIL
jgi:hypothetical protein